MSVIAINRAQGLAVTDADAVCPVSTWLDADGDETADAEAAVVAVVALPNGKWAAVDLREFEAKAGH